MRRVAWVLLAVVVAGAIAWAAWPDGGARTDRERARDLAAELRCPDCEGLSVADSSSSSAQAIRADLRRRIRAGQSDEAIRQGYVDRFGESILLNPEGEGLGVLVWGLPVLVLVVGAGGLVLALRRWHRQPAMHATPADEDLVRRVRETERAAAGGVSPSAASDAMETERAAAGGVSPSAASDAMETERAAAGGVPPPAVSGAMEEERG